MAKTVDFFDGAQSSTTPTIGNTDTTNLASYANDAAYEAANAGAPTEGNIYSNTTDNTIHYYNGTAWVSLADDGTAQTFTNKTLDGTSATGTNTISIDADDASYDNTTSGLTATNAQAAIDEVEGRLDTAETTIGTNTTASSDNASDIADIRTTTGTLDGDTDMGTFTGTILTSNIDLKTNLQELSDALEGLGSPLQFQGTWDADTNTPTLTSSTGTQGHFYIVSVAGSTNLDGITDWGVNDWAVFDGAVWRQIDNSEVVTSVNSQTGTVSLGVNDLDDVTGTNIARRELRRNSSNTLWEVYDPHDSANDTTAGSNVTLNQPATKSVKLSSGALVSVDEITAGYANQTFVMTNITANTITINNETGTTAANRILTGTSGPIDIEVNASILFIYDGLNSRWRIVGGTGSGDGGTSGIITGNNSTADSTIGDWVAYADAADSIPVDGTGGSSGLSVQRTTTASELLQGRASFKFTKGGISRQGEGVSLDVECPRYIRGQACKIAFSYQASANFDFGSAADPIASPSDISVFLYDVTNSKLLTPSQTGIFGGGLYEANVQIPSDCEDVRVILHIATTSALLYDFIFDRVELDVAPNEFLKNSSDWVPYTPTTSGIGTATNINFEYRTDGPMLQVRGRLTSGTVAASEAQINFPDGYITPTTLPTTQVVGYGAIAVNATQALTVLASPSQSYFTFGLANGGAAEPLTARNGNTLMASSQDLSFYAEVEIQGLTSGVSHPASVGLNSKAVLSAFDPSGSMTTAVANWATVEEDSLGAFNATTGEYTVKSPGDYMVSFAVNATAGGNAYSEVRVDGSIYKMTQGPNNANTVYGIKGVLIPNLSYGQVITVSIPSKTVSAATDANWINIHKIGSELQPYAPRIAYLKDEKTSGTSAGTFTAGAWQTRTLNTESGDNSFVSLSTNQFTLQAGTYHITAAAPAYRTDRHQIKLRNITDSTDDLIGSSEQSGSSNITGTTSQLEGTITISSAKVFEIQHRCLTTIAANGFGISSGFGVNEVYTRVKINKVL